MRLKEPISSIDYTLKVDSMLDTFFIGQIKAAKSISSYYEALWNELYTLIRSGGKRLRPKLTTLAYTAYGGTNVDGILPIASAQELLHLSMLIHDDIIDRDVIRYGVNNIAGSYQHKYESLIEDNDERIHFSESAALLGGDLLISSSYSLMLESTFPARSILMAQKILANGIFEVAGGELLDTESSFREIGTIANEDIARYKTASYSFISPLLIGATLANAPMSDLHLLNRIAINVGIAYQLNDDIIGTFSRSEITGKSIYSDTREGKNTALVEDFLQLATKEQKQEFARHFGNKTVSSDELDTVRNLFVTTGAKASVEKRIRAYTDEACVLISSLSIEEEFKLQLNDVLNTVTQRDR